MKSIRLLLGVLWILVNVAVLFGLFGRYEKTGYCLELYPPICKSVVQYGWPKPWLRVEEDSRTFVDVDELRRSALLFAAFLLPMLGIAVLTGRAFERAHTRD